MTTAPPRTNVRTPVATTPSKPSPKNGAPAGVNKCQCGATAARAACGTPQNAHTGETLLDVFIPGEPAPKGSMRHVGRGVMVHDSPKLARWMDTIRLVVGRKWRGELVDEPVEVTATFYLPAPKRPRFLLPATKPDGDKLQRALGDGLEGTILANDSRITDWHTKKRYTDPQHPIGAHVIIRKATL